MAMIVLPSVFAACVGVSQCGRCPGFRSGIGESICLFRFVSADTLSTSVWLHDPPRGVLCSRMFLLVAHVYFPLTANRPCASTAAPSAKWSALVFTATQFARDMNGCSLTGSCFLASC